MLFACLNTTESYIVTFESNGGTILQEIEVEENTPFLPNVLPTKLGYIFAGWYLDSGFNYPFSFHGGVKSDVKLYAKWELESMTEAQIRAYIDAVLSDIDLVIADQSTVIQIISDLIESGEVVDQQLIIETILAQLDVALLLERHITEMIERTYQGVVMIDNYAGNQLESGGSGVIYKRVGNTYYVVTNQHVTDGYQSGSFLLTIFTPNGTITIPRSQVTLLGESLLHDVAVLRFTSNLDLTVIEFANKDDFKLGQMVFSIGSPLDLPNTVSMGVISAIDRFMIDGYGMETYTVQHTAPINSGNSGGALVDIYGRLVGLNNMSYVDEYVGEGIEGLHFAIQIDVVIAILPQLENN